jgi:hypothetical protein
VSRGSEPGVTTTTERIIEAVLFLAPFLAFVAWRLFLAGAIPPAPVIAATAAFTILLLGVLIWLHQNDARNAGRAYIPAQLTDGRIIPGHAAPK